MTAVRSNVRKLAGGWELNAARGLTQYIRSWSSAAVRPAPSAIRTRREPIWLLLPEWLARTYGIGRGRRMQERKFLPDVLWGQFSVFLATKIQDDIFDDQLSDRSLLWVADELLLEARRAFDVHFTGSQRFWEFYSRAITTAVRAIDLVDQHQSGGIPVYRTVARLYPSMYAVCKIATKAVCLKAGNPEHFRRASQFLDELTVTGQLIDDLEDIGEDLERGRINAAAAFLAPGLRPGGKANLKKIQHAMLHTDALQRFFRVLHRHLRRAGDAMPFLKHPELAQFLRNYKESLSAAEECYLNPFHFTTRRSPQTGGTAKAAPVTVPTTLNS